MIGLDYKQFCDSGFNKSLNYLVKNVDGQPKIEIDYNVKNEENVEKKYYTAIEIISYIFKKIVRNTEDFIIETLEQKDVKIKILYLLFQLNILISKKRVFWRQQNWLE